MLSQEGIFRARVIEKAVRLPKEGSEAVNVSFKFEITQILQGKEWFDWSEHGMHCYGQICIVRKEGLTHDRGVEDMRDAFGWNGEIDPVEFEAWQPRECQINVKAEEYKGKNKYRAQYFNTRGS